ncbi:small ribosomal subunit protein mS23-like isoform X2 [Artemia franciscana]
MKPSDKPVWYDVYAAFPPKYEPRFNREPHSSECKRLLFKEDIVRAKFYKTFGSPGTINMFDRKPTVSQLFLDKYFELASLRQNQTEEELFEMTAIELEKTGLLLTSRMKKNVEQSEIKLNDSPSEVIEDTTMSNKQSLASMFKDAIDKQ